MGAMMHGVGRRVAAVVGVVVAVYFVARGVVEPFVIDVHDPATYRSDWGGPSLVGVLAVHSGPALVIVVGTVVWWVRRRRG